MWAYCLVYIVQVGRLTTQTNAIVHNLTVDFSFCHVNERHMCWFSYPLKRASSRTLRSDYRRKNCRGDSRGRPGYQLLLIDVQYTAFYANCQLPYCLTLLDPAIAYSLY